MGTTSLPDFVIARRTASCRRAVTRPNQTKLVDHDVEATDLRLNWRIRNNRHRVTILGTAAGKECSRKSGNLLAH